MKTRVELLIIMDENENLFDGLVQAGEYKFRVWLANNMRIYQYFVGFARELQQTTAWQCYSSRLIFERIRWESIIREDVEGGVVFKVNNNYAPFMARLVMNAEPELEGMFEIRGSRQ